MVGCDFRSTNPENPHPRRRDSQAPGPWPPSPYCRWQDRHSEKYLRENVEERLKNLGTDHLDVLLLHSWTRAWNRNPAPLEILKLLQREGKIRYFGISTPEHDQSALTGKLTEQTRFEEGDFCRNYFMGDRLKRTVAEVKKVQDDLSGSGYTLPQAALKFVLAHPAVSTSIPGMRNVDQVEANLAVSEMPDMSKDLLRTLQKHNWRRAFWYEGR